MATVSVEDLANEINEILRHHSSPQILHLLDGISFKNTVGAGTHRRVNTYDTPIYDTPIRGRYPVLLVCY
jgi:hypothetical protein